MILKLNVQEDQELRAHVKDLIRGQVKSILQDELKTMILGELKGSIRGVKESKIQKLINDAIVGCVSTLIKENSSEIKNEIKNVISIQTTKKVNATLEKSQETLHDSVVQAVSLRLLSLIDRDAVIMGLVKKLVKESCR